MTQGKFTELQDLMAQAIQFLNDNFDIHTIIIIQNNRFDVYGGKCGGGIGYFEKGEESCQK